MQLLPALEAGGVERGTVEVARELVRRGHRAIVVSAGGRKVRDLESAGAEHIGLPIGVKAPWTLRLVPVLRRLLLEERPDVLHLRSRMPAWIGYLAWRALPEGARPGLVTTVHGPYSVGHYSSVMTRGQRVIAISRTIREYILSNYPQTDPAVIRLIPRGVDPAAYPPGYHPPKQWTRKWRLEQPQLAGKHVLTYPARITRWKGQEEFLHLLARLRDTGMKDFHGLIVGGAEKRRHSFLEELKALARRLGLERQVTFLGHRVDLKAILAISDLSFSLTREPEAFGRTTLEALALGTPVVGYDHGGTGEILRAIFPQGLVPLGSVESAARRVWQLRSAPRPAIGENPFTLQAMLDATLAVYREVAPGGAG
ncbi:MAG: glycosyltransferase [Gammaproteobacteria bacterium]|nr:MAG: glycosyltransferase [Gammaproteobacteria bacterium]